MARQVRAAVVEKPGTKPVVQAVELAPLEHDEVLVRIAATGICHTDLAWASGELFPDFPVILGHESAGVVEEVGSGVKRVAPGDRVVLSLAHHCGHCFYCESGSPMLCAQRTESRHRFFRSKEPIVQGFGTGGFAEATIVREASAIPVPPDVPLDVAALTGCAVATGVGAALNIAQIRAGSTVAVLGCGGIGINVIMGAKLAGADRIVAVDPNPARREQALAFGATERLEPKEEGLHALAPEGFDYVFECVGATEPMELAVRITRRGGTTTLVGATPPGAQVTLNALDFVANQKRLLGCLTGDLKPNRDFDIYFRLYRKGLLPLDLLISGSVPLGEISDGFDRAASGEGIRTLVTMDSTA